MELQGGHEENRTLSLGMFKEYNAFTVNAPREPQEGEDISSKENGEASEMESEIELRERGDLEEERDFVIPDGEESPVSMSTEANIESCPEGPQRRNIVSDQGGQSSLRMNSFPTIRGVTKPAIRRLARRGGVIRISALTYDEVRESLTLYLEKIMKDAATFAEHAKRKVVQPMDVVYALKRNGQTIYGYGG